MTTQKSMLVNDQITVARVRLIDSDGTQVGVISTREAIMKASNQGLDLVVVAENSNPPVCKILDFGKAQYDAKKRHKQAKAKQTTVTTKEIQLRPVTDVGDLDRKIRDAKKFLDKGNRVRIQMRFRGREISHTKIGMDLMQDILADLNGEYTIEKLPVLNGNQILMVVAP